jgi:hypothetical protein
MLVGHNVGSAMDGVKAARQCMLEALGGNPPLAFCDRPCLQTTGCRTILCNERQYQIAVIRNLNPYGNKVGTLDSC